MSRYASAVPAGLSDDELEQDEFSDEEIGYSIRKFKKPPIGKGAGLDGSDFDSRLDDEGENIFNDILTEWSSKYFSSN